MWKLAFRLMLLVVAFVLYFVNIEMLDFTTILQQGFEGIYLWVVWCTLVVGMLYRIFPNKKIALGARKHFSCTYKGTPVIQIDVKDKARILKFLNKGAFLSAFTWLTVSVVIFFVLFQFDKLTPATILILALLYSVTDLVFILFFCPFQVIFMRNHCCAVCRIYNWDYFMMCAPLILFPSFYAISLFLLSIVVIIIWEVALYKNPHFFTKETNESLRCELCDDKLCKYVLLHNKKPVDKV